MIPPRDRAFLGVDVVLVAGPLSPAAIAGAEGALARLAAQPGWAWVGRAFPRRGPAPDLGTLRLDDLPDDADVVRAARAAGLGGGPVRLGIAGDRLVLLLDHAAADGIEAIALLGALLSVAVGEPAPRPDDPVALPLLRASRHAGPRAFLRYARTRGDRVASVVPAPAPSAVQQAREGALLRALLLDAGDLHALRTRVPAGGRATVSTRLVAAVVAGLRTAAVDRRDQPVRIPMDLRPAAGGRVPGTFVSVESRGGLFSADWTPAAVAVRLAEGREQAVPALVASALRAARPARRKAPDPGEYSVSVSVLPEPAAPQAAWRDGIGSVRGATIAPVWPSSTFVLIVLGPGRAAVSVWDEGGLFDLDRFADALLPATAGGPSPAPGGRGRTDRP